MKDATPDHFRKAWLFRVVENLIIDEARRKKHHLHIPLDDPNVETAETPNDPDLIALARLRTALDELSPIQRQTVTLRYLLEVSNEEIAHMGQKLYDASDAENKTILRIPHSGHNDIGMVGVESSLGLLPCFPPSL
jgi:RNA polymerase sigma factor (sigma-70 family)